MRHKKAWKREERKTMVITAMALKIQKGWGNNFTAYQIAKAIDMTPTSPHFRSILKEMVEQGMLESVIGRNSGKWNTYYYSIPRDMYNPLKCRVVNVRSRQQTVGQLELF